MERTRQHPTAKPIFVRIVSDYPDDDTTDLIFAVDPRFGETAAGLHARVLAAMRAAEVFAVQAADDPLPLEFSGELVRTVAVWEG